MQPAIDAHQHFWKYTPEEYGWIGPEMAALRRDFLPPDLERERRRVGVARSIAVQARCTTEETAWLLELAGANESIAGVVGWAPLTDARPEQYIERFAADRKLVGMRHVVQDEPDDEYLLRRDFNAGVEAVGRRGLVYDILIFERHLPAAIAFVDRHPSQTFVLDHIAKPRIHEGILSPWRENMRNLARRPNVYAKLSGMVTEADWQNWSPADLRPYFDIVLSAFTPSRLMFGSDWPVMLAASDYERWFGVVQNALSGLSEEEKARVFGRTAAEAYGLSHK